MARHFFPNEDWVEVDRSAITALSESELKEYVLSDAKATWMLAEYVYLPVLKSLAVDLNWPLNLAVHRAPSHVANTIYRRAFYKMGVVSDGLNKKCWCGLWEG